VYWKNQGPIFINLKGKIINTAERPIENIRIEARLIRLGTVVSKAYPVNLSCNKIGANTIYGLRGYVRFPEGPPTDDFPENYEIDSRITNVCWAKTEKNK
jgi:hypothetical protein